jgi:hypothetical protein
MLLLFSKSARCQQLITFCEQNGSVHMTAEVSSLLKVTNEDVAV